jgi:hypothetical protein
LLNDYLSNKLFGSALKKEKSYGRNRKCDVMEEEFWIKPPMAPKKGCKAQTKKVNLVTPYGLVGQVRRKSLIYIFCDAVVFGIEI